MLQFFSTAYEMVARLYCRRELSLGDDDIAFIEYSLRFLKSSESNSCSSNWISDTNSIQEFSSEKNEKNRKKSISINVFNIILLKRKMRFNRYFIKNRLIK